MNFKTHVVGGIGAGVIANEYLLQHFNTSGQEPTTMLMTSLFIAGSTIGSIMPDIDHRGSFIGRRMKLTSLTFNVVGGATKGINKALGKRGKSASETIISHRGITHTPILTIAIISILLFISNNFVPESASPLFTYMSVGFGIGILSHIFLDSITKGGVPLFYPITSKKFSFLPLETGGMLENFVRLGMAIGTLWFVLKDYINF